MGMATEASDPPSGKTAPFRTANTRGLRTTKQNCRSADGIKRDGVHSLVIGQRGDDAEREQAQRLQRIDAGQRVRTQPNLPFHNA